MSYSIIKRVIDVTIASLVGVFLIPVGAAITIIIALKFGSPIFFKQVRPGLNGKPFLIYKFRTMHSSFDNYGNLLPDNMRLTTLGKFLRSTSLDELPSLLNVIKGELSLVGPRPLLMEYLPLYTIQQARRHEVVPGVTGWAQVNGRNAITWEEKFNLDVWYVEHQSFWLDMKIILVTIKKVIFREGISAKNEATMPKFTGNKSQ